MKLIVATHNKNKVQEIKEILKDTTIEVISLIDLNDFEEIIEDGNTFAENATIKALTIAKKYNQAAIADDSGIMIDYLNGAPGIYSARYSGNGDLANNHKVLEELSETKIRGAQFISVIALAYPNGDVKTFEGIWKGAVATNMKGDNGFGYDSIFIPEGYNVTAAELLPAEKDKISHRARALKLLKEHLE